MAAGDACHSGRGVVVTAAGAATRECVAFGFRLDGLRAPALMPASRPDWPTLHVQRRIGPPGDGTCYLGDAGARLSLPGAGCLELDRAAGTATYLSARALDDDTLVHPLLSPAAAVAARWLGREAFHAGALLGDDGAWALAGTNQAGKSTLLASLALGGRPILTDDLLVVDRDGLAYTGPRCIDLRALDIVGADIEERVRPVRGATRRRLDLPAANVAATLQGWIFLEWGSHVEAEPCPAKARIGRLMAQRRWAAGAIEPSTLLELAARPAWILRRPRGAQHTAAVLDLLDRLVGEAPAAAPSRRSHAPSPLAVA
jgi:hypothetical protein